MSTDSADPVQSSPAEPVTAVAEAGLNLIGADLPSTKSLPSDSQESKELYGADKQRQERVKEVFHWAFLSLLVVAAIVFILVFVIRAFHFILPDNTAENAHLWFHCWLDERQLQSIDKFFFSGALGALVSRYLGTAFPRKDSEQKRE